MFNVCLSSAAVSVMDSHSCERGSNRGQGISHNNIIYILYIIMLRVIFSAYQNNLLRRRDILFV